MERLTFGFGGLAAILIIGAWIAGLIGWCLNIFKLLGIATSGFSGQEAEAVIRAIGIFAAPLGAVAGWF